jgi:hypothetical protein
VKNENKKMEKREREELERELNLLFAKTFQLENELNSLIINRK